MEIAKIGKKHILMFRELGKAGTDTGAKLALQTSHTWNYARSVDTTQTKDGAVVGAGALEVTLNIDAVASSDPVNKMLKQSVIDGKKLEVWEVNLEEKTGNKYAALYAQGNLESWETPAEVEGLVTLSTSMKIDGAPQEGQVTLTAEQEAEISYAFRDITPVTGG